MGKLNTIAFNLCVYFSNNIDQAITYLTEDLRAKANNKTGRLSAFDAILINDVCCSASIDHPEPDHIRHIMRRWRNISEMESISDANVSIYLTDHLMKVYTNYMFLVIKKDGPVLLEGDCFADGSLVVCYAPRNRRSDLRLFAWILGDIHVVS